MDFCPPSANILSCPMDLLIQTKTERLKGGYQRFQCANKLHYALFLIKMQHLGFTAQEALEALSYSYLLLSVIYLCPKFQV